MPQGLRRSGNWFNVKTLYHCTNRFAAGSIRYSGDFEPGRKGMFGPGIYFAESARAARTKSRHATADDCVVITAHVWLGFMLEVPCAMNDLTMKDVYDYGCHSIHGKTRSTGDEYVIFEPRNVLRMSGFEGLEDVEPEGYSIWYT
jgi:hypothetical protein